MELSKEQIWLQRRLRAEAEARARGCSHVMLTTYSFQARGCYEKEGYRVVGEMTGYPPGAMYCWMRKDL